MAPTVPHLIDLDDDSDGSIFSEEIVDESRIGRGVEGLSISPSRGRTEHANGGHRTRPEDYQACLTDILDVFPDISHEYVQEIYNKHMESRGPYQPESPSQALIEKVLDSGHYPKEKDRRKRKFSERDSDEEEAAKWKYKDLRDDPNQYQTVAYVLLLFLSCKLPLRVHERLYCGFMSICSSFLMIRLPTRHSRCTNDLTNPKNIESSPYKKRSSLFQPNSLTLCIKSIIITTGLSSQYLRQNVV